MNLTHHVSSTFEKDLTWFGNMAQSGMLNNWREVEMKITALLEQAYQRGYTCGHDDANHGQREHSSYRSAYS